MLSAPRSSYAKTDEIIPADSRIGSAPADFQRLLISPLDLGSVQWEGKYKLTSTSVEAYAGQKPKAGLVALKFGGVAASDGGKGDFTITENPPGEIQELGMWVYLSPDSNVSRVGFQISDAEDESLMALVNADWEGWKWVEFNLLDATFSQSYNKQDGKSRKAEFPLKSIHIVWFVQKEGRTSLGVDVLAGLSKIETPAETYSVESISPHWGEPATPFQGQVVIHNFSDKPQDFQIGSSLQTNPTYETPVLPDPIQGSDLAQGQPSWIEMEGLRIEDNCLTDGDDASHLKPKMPKTSLPEIFHYVDLGKSKKVTSIAWMAGDANWINKLDISASDDGKTYTPVDALQNLDLYRKWRRQSLVLDRPFPARFLRLRYHNGGETLPPHFRTLATLLVFDGSEGENLGIPAVGKEISNESLTVQVPPKSFSLVAFKPTPPVGTDAYLFGVATETGGLKKAMLADYFVMPSSIIKPAPSSRFGINVSVTSHIPVLARAGFGWVRFENMKWCFYNPAPDDFRFDGTVAPWYVPFDEYYKIFHESGLSILPYIFRAPAWASTAPEGTEKNVGSYPPKDPADYGKAIFQAVARYASAKVPQDELRTPDKVSALNRINTYELWNEPNLSAPGWGFFVGPLTEFYPVFRAGAEAAKKADPKAIVANGGWAGLSMEWVDTMRTFKYPDGKTPLDFTDVMNVHFYSGKSDPEYSTKDPNAFRDGAKSEEIQTLENDLVDLADWRDELKPGMPIWVTETGNDVGGPIGLTERAQAAKLPRGNMLSFANGVEKVFIYREKGSDPVQHGGAGLLRNDSSLRASYFTVANAIRQFDGVTETRVPRLRTADPGVWMYYWKRTGGDVLTAWSPKGPAPLGVDLGRCLVTGAFGAEKEMEVTKDFPLSIFPVYISKIGRMDTIAALQEQAEEREAARKKQMALDVKAEALLFDFGSTEFIGTKKVGKIRRFIPVLLEDIYDPAKGYGFDSEVKGSNGIARWKPSPIEKDFIQFKRPATFRVLAKPGIFRLQFKGGNFQEHDELIVTGAREGEIKIPLQPGKEGAPTTVQTLTAVAGQPLEIHLPVGTAEWLTLIESPKG